MKHTHLRQGRKGFIGWSSQQPHLCLQGALKELWEWGVETNAWPTWETETEVQAGSCWNPWCLSCRQACKSTKILGYLTAQPCLSPWVVFPRCGERKGTTTLSRLASASRALLYPPLPNTARAALWDLTNPLLFQGLRVLAFDPSCPILPLAAYAWVHWTLHRERVLAVILLGHSGQICSNGTHVCVNPLTWPQWVSIPFCSPLIWESRPALEREWVFIPAGASSADLLTKLYV